MDLEECTIHRTGSRNVSLFNFRLFFNFGHVLCVYVKTRRVIITITEICLDEKIKRSMNLIMIAYYLFFFRI